MHIRQLLLPVLAAIVILFLGLGYSRSQVSHPCEGCDAPNVELVFYDGYDWREQSASSLTDMTGQIVVLNFWASWCVPCQQEAPILEGAWRTYAEDDVIFLGVAWSDTDREALKFLEEYDITYPNAPDIQMKAEDKYQFSGIPETFFINDAGVIHKYHPGPITERLLTATLDEMVAAR